ncbi:enoyl-CoA hydratase-related protein [Devosia sp.]|uniref:enoyl-CoA hydratase-related protein n=1 Tax=Devosia sp. TaxID=1871048 RepID=UPI002EF38C69
MQDLLWTTGNGVATVTLNRPERLNAFSDSMVFGLIELLGEFERRDDTGVIVITGAGRGFCAGGDVKGMAETAVVDVDARVAALQRKHGLIRRIRSAPQVVVAAINGVAAGAGLALALACDVRIASRTARLGATYARVGLPGDYGISYLLPQAVGRPMAQQLLLSGRMVEAEEALGLGLVTTLFASEDFSAGVAEFAEGIARGPRLAYAAMKRNLCAGEQGALDAVLDCEARNLVAALLTADHREAALAFTEKRQPVFRGR